jgi:hypothetical protein
VGCTTREMLSKRAIWCAGCNLPRWSGQGEAGGGEFHPIMQNKPNLRRAEMNVRFFMRKGYENRRAFGAKENKADVSPSATFLLPETVCVQM